MNSPHTALLMAFCSLGWIGLCVMIPKYIGSKYGETEPPFRWIFSIPIAWIVTLNMIAYFIYWLKEHVRFI